MTSGSLSHREVTEMLQEVTYKSQGVTEDQIKSPESTEHQEMKATKCEQILIEIFHIATKSPTFPQILLKHSQYGFDLEALMPLMF